MESILVLDAATCDIIIEGVVIGGTIPGMELQEPSSKIFHGIN